MSRADVIRRDARHPHPAPEPREPSRDEMAAVVAHDLLEPLTTVTGFLSLLGERHGAQLGPDGRALLHLAAQGAANMGLRVEALLDQARLGAVVPDLAPVDLREATAATCASLAASISQRGAVIECASEVTVPADPRLFDRLLQQLLANGIKFARPGRGPHLRVTGQERDGCCLVTVADDGIGIDPAFRDRVFEMFVRAGDPAVYPGSGIGLAQCRAIVEAHRGAIWIEDSHLGGTAVVMAFPQVDFPEITGLDPGTGAATSTTPPSGRDGGQP